MKKILFALTLASLLQAEEYDLVIQGGRAMDPETGLDAIRHIGCLLYTSPSPRDKRQSRMPSSA